jgi:hypothetical protein
VWTVWRSENYWLYQDWNLDPSVVQILATDYTDCTTAAHTFWALYNIGPLQVHNSIYIVPLELMSLPMKHAHKWPYIKDSSVGMASGYGVADRQIGVRIPVRSIILSSSCRPARIRDALSRLCGGYRRDLSEAKATVAWIWPLNSD